MRSMPSIEKSIESVKSLFPGFKCHSKDESHAEKD